AFSCARLNESTSCHGSTLVARRWCMMQAFTRAVALWALSTSVARRIRRVRRPSSSLRGISRSTLAVAGDVGFTGYRRTISQFVDRDRDRGRYWPSPAIEDLKQSWIIWSLSLVTLAAAQQFVRDECLDRPR